jgi:phosphatidylcholine synthase
VRVKEALPGFDGTLLDNLIDLLTYTFLPLLLLWRAQVVPDELAWCLLPCLLASAYGFCQVDAKTADGYFRGFPSYWNIVALYLYLWQPPLGVTVGLLWLLAVLSFVPSVYIYPTRGGGWINILTNVLGAIWAVLLLWIVIELLKGPSTTGERVPHWLMLSSLVYPVLYMTASWVISVRRWWRGGVA